MLNIAQGPNVVAVTLSEAGHSDLAPIGVRLTSKSTGSVTILEVIEDSPHPERCNILRFDAEGLPPGQYRYEVVSLGSPEILFESGLAVVLGEAAAPSQFSSGGAVTVWRG